MWTSLSRGNILDVLRDCKTWQSLSYVYCIIVKLEDGIDTIEN